MFCICMLCDASTYFEKITKVFKQPIILAMLMTLDIQMGYF